jgi:4-hydroxy-tetrahydrodipicolinate reductase
MGSGSSLKLALIGYGKMGRAIEVAALKQGHQVVARVDKDQRLEEAAQADVWIDFSHADGVRETVEGACRAGKALVIGTTGWEKDRADVERCVAEAGIGAIWSPNYSLGVFLFSKLVQMAARLSRAYPQFDVGMMEWHHRHKKDAPAGTAKALQELIRVERGVAPECAVVRAGECPGEYRVMLDDASDTVELVHRARNRDSYADGAVLAARMVQGRKGLHRFTDLLEAL